jgi:hypothetical protein
MAPAILHHKPPPCIRPIKGPLGGVPQTTGSTAKQSGARNTTARQIPPAIPQRPQAESEPREQNLWSTRIRRGQEAHGDEEVPQHDESRGHLLALVLAQQVNTPVDNNGTSPTHPSPPSRLPANQPHQGILVSLAVIAWYLDFISKTIFAHLLPTRKDFLRHPFESTGRFIEVCELYQQQRLKKAEEVEKRKQYRLERLKEAEAKGDEYVEDSRYYVGEDGVRRRRVKRWFGIWE